MGRYESWEEAEERCRELEEEGWTCKIKECHGEYVVVAKKIRR
jgi:hypothetical protein